MLTRLNFLTVYLCMFVLTLASTLIVPPLTEQAFAPDQTRLASIDVFKEVGK